jgi:hypothetical protein
VITIIFDPPAASKCLAIKEELFSPAPGALERPLDVITRDDGVSDEV